VTRMIEHWFPCAEVSANSANGLGSGNVESSLWVWFAKRPVAQSMAAVVTSLLPWPDDAAEQDRLKALVRAAVSGKRRAHTALETIIGDTYGHRPRLLDPFSGRAMIPLEAARLDIDAFGVDYSPFASIGGALLADLLHRDWSAEKPLPFQADGQNSATEDRLLTDATVFLAEVGARQRESMERFYPKFGGNFPWGYLWASTLPCRECGRRFPLVGELHLRLPDRRRSDVSIQGWA
jgi:putative DNA methylase